MTQTALDLKPSNANPAAAGAAIPPTPDTTTEKNDAASYLSIAERFAVTDAETYEGAIEQVKRGKAAEAKVEEKLGPIRDAAHKAHKGACNLIAELTGPFTKGMKLLTDKALEWKRAEDEKQLKAEEEAREKARKDAEEAQLKEAIAVEQEYGKEAADAILDAPPPVVATPVVASYVPRVAGFGTTKTYHAEITNIALIPREHLLATDNQREALQSHLNALAKAAKKTLAIPGVKVVEGNGSRVRA